MYLCLNSKLGASQRVGLYQCVEDSLEKRDPEVLTLELIKIFKISLVKEKFKNNWENVKYMACMLYEYSLNFPSSVDSPLAISMEKTECS